MIIYTAQTLIASKTGGKVENLTYSDIVRIAQINITSYVHKIKEVMITPNNVFGIANLEELLNFVIQRLHFTQQKAKNRFYPQEEF